MINALLEVAKSGKVSEFDNFIEQRSPTQHEIDSAFLLSCLEGEVKAVSFLANLVSKIGCMDVNGETGLNLSAKSGHLLVSSTLINLGLDVNIRSKSGLTPLFSAVQSDQREMTAFLLERKANINAVDNNRNTILHMAAQSDLPHLVKLILKSGACTNVFNDKDETPLEVASTTDICRLILEHHSGYEEPAIAHRQNYKPMAISPFRELPPGPASYLFWTAMGVGKDSYMFQNFGVFPFDRLDDTERIIVLTEVAEAMSGYKVDLKCNILNESALFAVFALMKARIKKELDDAESEDELSRSYLWRKRVLEAYEQVYSTNASLAGLAVECWKRKVWHAVVYLLARSLFGESFWEKKDMFHSPNASERCGLIKSFTIPVKYFECKLPSTASIEIQLTFKKLITMSKTFLCDEPVRPSGSCFCQDCIADLEVPLTFKLQFLEEAAEEKRKIKKGRKGKDRKVVIVNKTEKTMDRDKLNEVVNKYQKEIRTFWSNINMEEKWCLTEMSTAELSDLISQNEHWETLRAALESYAKYAWEEDVLEITEDCVTIADELCEEKGMEDMLKAMLHALSNEKVMEPFDINEPLSEEVWDKHGREMLENLVLAEFARKVANQYMLKKEESRAQQVALELERELELEAEVKQRQAENKKSKKKKKKKKKNAAAKAEKLAAEEAALKEKAKKKAEEDAKKKKKAEEEAKRQADKEAEKLRLEEEEKERKKKEAKKLEAQKLKKQKDDKVKDENNKVAKQSKVDKIKVPEKRNEDNNTITDESNTRNSKAEKESVIENNNNVAADSVSMPTTANNNDNDNDNDNDIRYQSTDSAPYVDNPFAMLDEDEVEKALLVTKEQKPKVRKSANTSPTSRSKQQQQSTYEKRSTTPNTNMDDNISTKNEKWFSHYLDGMMFICTKDTYKECMDLKLLGLPRQHLRSVRALRPHTSALFLFNVSDRHLHGIYEATAPGGENLRPEAWKRKDYTRHDRNSPFPAQVPIKCIKEFRPISEMYFRHLFPDGNRIRKLDRGCVMSLCQIFEDREQEPDTNVPAPRVLRKVSERQPSSVLSYDKNTTTTIVKSMMKNNNQTNSNNNVSNNAGAKVDNSSNMAGIVNNKQSSMNVTDTSHMKMQNVIGRHNPDSTATTSTTTTATTKAASSSSGNVNVWKRRQMEQQEHLSPNMIPVSSTNVDQSKSISHSTNSIPQSSQNSISQLTPNIIGQTTNIMAQSPNIMTQPAVGNNTSVKSNSTINDNFDSTNAFPNYIPNKLNTAVSHDTTGLNTVWGDASATTNTTTSNNWSLPTSSYDMFKNTTDNNNSGWSQNPVRRNDMAINNTINIKSNNATPSINNHTDWQNNHHMLPSNESNISSSHNWSHSISSNDDNNKIPMNDWSSNTAHLMSLNQTSANDWSNANKTNPNVWMNKTTLNNSAISSNSTVITPVNNNTSLTVNNNNNNNDNNNNINSNNNISNNNSNNNNNNTWNNNNDFTTSNDMSSFRIHQISQRPSSNSSHFYSNTSSFPTSETKSMSNNSYNNSSLNKSAIFGQTSSLWHNPTSTSIQSNTNTQQGWNNASSIPLSHDSIPSRPLQPTQQSSDNNMVNYNRDPWISPSNIQQSWDSTNTSTFNNSQQLSNDWSSHIISSSRPTANQPPQQQQQPQSNVISGLMRNNGNNGNTIWGYESNQSSTPTPFDPLVNLNNDRNSAPPPNLPSTNTSGNPSKPAVNNNNNIGLNSNIWGKGFEGW